ncbi:flagellar hook-basal body protein [Thermodesulfobacterium geofontis OPF15]|jgi:flagellar hook protein FlgE|uniref:Flagellar hook protein FlgE n=1 Tax=Thermodesulfobacterium geofontis (strain OPF15) TaxID=795359 RepID=F8C248_THEGP|nr:flagellar hook protein FlgE [Thermodesulfobacterium geofontis]AEH22202.1 flagellar hook-basal body protein [Thermodesulfobacterium geofontis OPF15]
MGLTDALFTGTSGLRSLGHGMSVVGDNVANLNTTAFKASRVSFSDIMAQSINTASGSGQLGRGATLQALYPIFTQGSFESTANPTDLAIAGNGFFIVNDPRATGRVFYTRDGQFMIDKEGYLVNAAGLRVQGWKIDEATGDITGAITDIRIDRSSPPVKTSLVDVITNLNAEVERNTTIDNTNNAIFGDNSITDNNKVTLWGKWDATLATPLATTDYNYRTSLYIYDSLGTPHEITIYYRAVNLTDGTTTKPVYEFLVTCNPNEDLRQGFSDNTKKGVLMYGMLEFDTQGNVKNFLNVYRYGWDANNNQYQLVRIVNNNGIPQNPPPNDAFAESNYFTTTIGALGANSYPILIADFLGIKIADNNGNEDPSATRNLQPIELNFGYYHDGTSWRSETVRTTQYSAPFATLFYDQNGYGPGTLESIAADNEGRITGYYSNGRVIPLWMVALANFNAPERLQKVGGNLFKETTHSGPPVTGKPGTNGLGTIAPNSIEQSNVDLGEQFVKMIIFQRGFQADARIITVSDSMLEELINLKR